MINVTDNAVRQLQSLLSQRPENSRQGLRVEVAKGGCSGLHYEMTLGEREEGDSIVERDGVTLGWIFGYGPDAVFDFAIDEVVD